MTQGIPGFSLTLPSFPDVSLPNVSLPDISIGGISKKANNLLKKYAKQFGVQFTFVDVIANNRDHFQPHAQKRWREGHLDAIRKASHNLKTALARNGFADHFLADSFAAGHQIDYTKLRQSGGRSWVKTNHDRLSQYGIQARNERGDRWKMYGDDFFHKMGQRGKDITLEAIALSVDDIFLAASGRKVPMINGKYRAELLIHNANLSNRPEQGQTNTIESLNQWHKYGLPLPIWVVCEIWDFGTLSTLFAGMTKADQDEIANKYRISDGQVLASWLRSLNYLRNVCAHHSRLWNRNIVDQPKLPRNGEVSWTDPFIGNSHCLARPFLLLCISKHLLTTINPSSTWGERLKKY